MNPRVLVIVLLFIFMNKNLPAQTGRIEGYVTSEVGDTIAGATVLLGIGNFAMSDQRGWYSFETKAGSYQLECRFTGYELYRSRVAIKSGLATRKDIMLVENINPLAEIVVSADRYEQKLGEVTVSMEVIKPALLQNKNTTSLDEIINQVPGVQVADGQASIRGGSGFSYGAGSRVLMLVDELPMISADAGDIKWNYLPLENLEQIEVIKGASSVLYGSGALNGVINLRTAFARNKPVTQASVYYGMYDAPANVYKWWKGSSQSQKGINFSHAQKTGNLDIVIGTHKFEDDGYRMLETESRDRFNAGLKYSFKKASQLSAGVNTNMMNTRGGLFFLWRNYDSAYVPQGFDIQRYNNNRFNVDPWVSWTGRGDSLGNYKISLRNRYFKTHNRNDKGQGSYSELYYSELQFIKDFRNRLNLTAGTVYMAQTILGDAIYGRHDGENVAAYVQLRKKYLSEKLTVSAGVRGEYYRIDSARTAGYLFRSGQGLKLPFQPVLRMGLNYRAAEQTYFRASFGQGYRFPSAAEKFVNTSVGVLKIFPNPSLQPERSYSAELSMKQGFRVLGFRGYADVAAFYTRYNNMIEFVFDIYRPGGASGEIFSDLLWAGFKSQNVGEAEISGAELSISGAGHIGAVKTTVFAGYTYINPLQPGYNPLRDTLGLPGVNTLKYRSRHLAKADVQFDYERISFGYSARYQSKVENIDRRFVQSILHEYNNPAFGLNFDDNPATYVLPGFRENFAAFSKAFLIQDLRMGVQVTEIVRVSVIVNNFMNVEYQNRPGDIGAPTMYLLQLRVKL